MELPVAFCDEMKRILGDEYEDYLKSMEGTRKFGLRVNTAKIISLRNIRIILRDYIICRTQVR